MRDAQLVVSTADSLRAEGQMYSDSVQLAQAYETLDKWQLIYPDDYAHACYHYGRLLREKEDPVTAMQVFINAAHSRTHDYHILGRIYSNMGSICHLAGEYPLSYDMYEQSANMFLRDGDTIAYFYALNDMAFELAEQKRKDDALTIIRQIEENCTDYNVLTKTLETRAEACLNVQQYDSVVYYSHLLCSRGNSEPTTFLLRAKAYSMMGCKDSSVYYAQYVLSISNELFDQNSALYILTHNDDSKDREDVRQISADRSDVQKLIEIHQSKLSQAVQLLEQDLNRKPDLRWLYAIIGTLVIISCIIGIYIYRKYKKQELLTQKIDVLEKTANTIQEKKDELSEHYLTSHKNIENEIENRCSMLRTNDSIKKTLAWKNYSKMCNVVDKRFYFLASKLRNKYSLNETEVRLCILTLLECEYDRMAELLYRSSTSIGTLKIRVARKLGTTAKELRRYLIDNVCIT